MRSPRARSAARRRSAATAAPVTTAAPTPARIFGSGSGTDVFCAAQQVGAEGSVIGVDFTPEQIQKAIRLRDRAGIEQVEFIQASIDELPFEDESFDAVISNGVINLSPVKGR